MQEGAGVRQVIDDELREKGMRLRDLDVRLELGLQESVKSAVEAGHGVTFISRTAVEPELAARHPRGGSGRGPRALPRDLAGSRRRPRVDSRRRRVRRVRPGTRVNVRWGLEELPGLLDELGKRAAVPRGEPALGAAGRGRRALVGGSLGPDRRRGAGGRAADVLLALGGGSAIDLAKAISVETGLPVVSIPTTYSGAEWTPSFGVRDHDRRRRGGGSGADLAGIVYDPELTPGCRERRRSAPP